MVIRVIEERAAKEPIPLLFVTYHVNRVFDKKYHEDLLQWSQDANFAQYRLTSVVRKTGDHIGVIFQRALILNIGLQEDDIVRFFHNSCKYGEELIGRFHEISEKWEPIEVETPFMDLYASAQVPEYFTWRPIEPSLELDGTQLSNQVHLEELIHIFVEKDFYFLDFSSSGYPLFFSDFGLVSGEISTVAAIEKEPAISIEMIYNTEQRPVEFIGFDTTSCTPGDWNKTKGFAIKVANSWNAQSALVRATILLDHDETHFVTDYMNEWGVYMDPVRAEKFITQGLYASHKVREYCLDTFDTILREDYLQKRLNSKKRS